MGKSESKLESEFQGKLIKLLEQRFPNCVILVKPGYYIQGFPDLLILYKKQWAALECKRSLTAEYQPNQEWWIGELDNIGFSAMVCPENMKEIIDEMVRSFETGR